MGRGRREKGGKGKGRDDLPYELGDLEMTWLLWRASAATAYWPAAPRMKSMRPAIAETLDNPVLGRPMN